MNDTAPSPSGAELVGTLEIRGVSDIHGEFVVPSYQRGYRWTDHEVGQLLSDIRASGGETYYLQPIVVKRLAENCWELIDGQQRLTTLYLIYGYLGAEHLQSAKAKYSISYVTRPGSAAFLETLDREQADENIDFFHLHRAHRCITAWFEQFGDDEPGEAIEFHQHLFKSVKLLWYEVPDEVDSIELFRRLNVGRIPLTDAELIKALLLSHSRTDRDHTDRSVEIAAHWDRIEQDLRVPEAWAFVTGEATGRATHISLLLDTLAGGSTGRERRPFDTFDDLRKAIEADPQAFWREVVALHSLVLGWYEDRDLFHKIGYLVAVGHSFQDLVDRSKGLGRRAFDKALDRLIRTHLGLTRSAVADLAYRGTKTQDVLLLMNTEAIRTMQGSSERYSFQAHANGDWTEEHIHAQRAEDLTTARQWTAWLAAHREALADLPGLDEDQRARLVVQIDEALSRTVTRHAFRAVEREVTAAFSIGADSTDDLDSIANLALLNNRDNAALSNAVFEVKRRRIIERDVAGSYIPTCTRNVFLKYYTRSADQQIHFWSAADREAYLEALRGCLDRYLEPDEAER